MWPKKEGFRSFATVGCVLFLFCGSVRLYLRGFVVDCSLPSVTEAYKGRTGNGRLEEMKIYKDRDVTDRYFKTDRTTGSKMRIC